MGIETELARYGIFGLWTLSNLAFIWYLLRVQNETHKAQLEVVKNNTSTMQHLIIKIDNLK